MQCHEFPFLRIRSVFEDGLCLAPVLQGITVRDTEVLPSWALQWPCPECGKV